MTVIEITDQLAAAVVPPQGGYVAKQCAVRADRDHDKDLDPELKVAPSAADQKRMDEGVVFEGTIGVAMKAALRAVEIGAETDLTKVAAAWIPSCDRTIESKRLREALTSASMEAGVVYIWNARLAADLEGSRTSEPDMLVRVGNRKAANGKWVYAPIDVKHHASLEGDSAAGQWLVSTLNDPRLEKADERLVGAGKPQLDDSMQLAHYHRHLEFLGHGQTTPQVWGGIIGKEGIVLWRDLSSEMYAHTDSRTGVRRTKQSALSIYDEEFAFRLDVIRHAIARGEDPTIESLVSPEWKDECKSCHWKTVCHDDLEAADHVTLLQTLTPGRAKSHYDQGVKTRSELARLDWKTAVLVDAGADINALLAAAAGVDGATSVEALLPARQNKVRQAIVDAFALIGVTTAAELRSVVDPVTARYAGSGVYRLADAIDRARVAKVEEVHLRRSVRKLEMLRADVELDVDMENDPGGVIYLWGTRLTVRAKELIIPGPAYRPFVTFVENDTDGEAEAFRRLWEWITTLRGLAKNTGLSFKAYCYTGAEERCFRSLANKHAGKTGVPAIVEIEEFLASDEWVDMHKVLDSQTIWPTEDLGLKSTAKWARFSWRESGANGDQSTVWYQEAVSGDIEAQQRLLDYNEDDVTATWHLREWLTRLTKARTQSEKIANVATLDKRFRRRRTLMR